MSRILAALVLCVALSGCAGWYAGGDVGRFSAPHE